MKPQDRENSDRGLETPEQRRRYEKPVLKELGNVSELTRGPLGTSADGKDTTWH